MLRGEGYSTKNNSLGHPWFDEHLLLREMTHRVKNELASAIGFASLTAARSDNREVKVALAGVAENLYNYARVYQALQMPMDDHCVDAGSYLQELCQAIGGSKLKCKGIELVLTDFELQLRAEQCWRLGMIISELITNASRHAFSEGGGMIRIEFLQRGHSVECRVTDNGCGTTDIRPGHGMKIVEALAHSLNGEIDQRFEAYGTISILSFPLREERSLVEESDGTTRALST